MDRITMRFSFSISVTALSAILLFSAPAHAQGYWVPPNFSGPPVNGYEPGMGVPLPNATPAEQNAALIWNLRAGLNVAALQCAFEPTLRTMQNYNAILNDHSAELASSFNTLTAYFKRVNKSPALGQKALDTFGTKTYSGFSTVRAQVGFCYAASRIGRIGLFTPKGRFITLAQEHLRELRNSLTPQGEQQFRIRMPDRVAAKPNFVLESCWKKGKYLASCGYQS
ncbi:hypothetical protein [Aquisediminimonas profunda]|uniref:hypothetical protein n=1 Tax=Aquisediminimonas profunda TaxID=1550733 RepID=UPI001FE6F16F|nr:hypothetical protein [Aquisediminimonas profunda]